MSTPQKPGTFEQKWKHLDAEQVQIVGRLLESWRIEVERRSETIFLDSSDRKTRWQRARNPGSAMRAGTWQRHFDKLIGFLNEDWNLKPREGEDPLIVTREIFFKGPPSYLMEPNMSADLQEVPRTTPASIGYLLGYLNDLRTRVERAQLDRNITAERLLRHSITTTLESLEAWESAAQELDYLIEINEALGDYTYSARALLRKGTALYRCARFDQARKTFERAMQILRDRLPPNAALRTEIRVWDYMGLCYVRVGQPKEALEVFLDKGHQRRAESLSLPLGDASRSVRIGIAYLELGQNAQAKKYILQGLNQRIQIQALAEAALALRYLGFFYYTEKKFQQALCIWEIALKIQRGFGNEVEQTKLHFFRGSVFHRLLELAEAPDAQIFPDGQIRCAISEMLFPDSGERKILESIASRFRDVSRSFPIRHFSSIAHASYDQCREIGSRRNLPDWVIGAEEAAKSLPVLERL